MGPARQSCQATAFGIAGFNQKSRVPGCLGRARWPAALWLAAALAAPGAVHAQPSPAAAALTLGLPIDCPIPERCLIQNLPDVQPGPGVRDHRCGRLAYDGHDGTDFRVPDARAVAQGVTVRAAAAGMVLIAQDGGRDHLSTDPGPAGSGGAACGNGVLLDHGGGWTTEYCHLRRGSVAVREGQSVAAGAPLGLVGLSGRTVFPHLHFAVARQGRPVDPFTGRSLAAGNCHAGGRALWAAGVPAAAIAYWRPVLYLAGWSDRPVSRADVLGGAAAGASRALARAEHAAAAPALVAWVQAIGLRAGDQLMLRIVDPSGATAVERRYGPLTHDQAEATLWVGQERGRRRRWAAGRWRAEAEVQARGQLVARRGWSLDMAP